MQIVHLGQSCVLVETGTARLLLDPGVYSTGFAELTDLDAILVTHQHPDHLDMDRLPALLAANPAAELLVDSGSAPMLTNAGIAHRIVRPGQRLELGSTAVDVIGGDAGIVLHPGDGLDPCPRSVDLLFLPTAAPWLKVSEAADYLRAVAPVLAIPIHQAILAKPDKYYGLFRELAPAGTDVQIAVPGEALKL